MKILYASTFIDDNYFEQIYKNSKEKPIQSIQKFNKLLNEGFSSNKSVDSITILTSPPINQKISKKLFWSYKKVEEDKTTFVYLPFINIKVIKQICLFLSSLFFMIVWSLKTTKKGSNIIYDGFFPIISTVSAFIGKIFGIKVTGMYTDLPKFMNHNQKKQSIYKKLAKAITGIGDNISIRLCDSFIFLTEHMNTLINKENKPYIIMEGLVDGSIDINEKIVNKGDEKIFMYAGGLYEQYGLKTFVEAFIMANTDSELWLFGTGELEDYIKSIKSDNIKFFGSKPNKEIIEYEKKATILVNPRFSNEEYTKYSFPSKNLEYMSSGTPLLTTKLPGIPSEYDDYVYYFNKEDTNGYCDKIKEMINISNKELTKRGLSAQRFVCTSKNNYVQSNRIISMIKE